MGCIDLALRRPGAAAVVVARGAAWLEGLTAILAEAGFTVSWSRPTVSAVLHSFSRAAGPGGAVIVCCLPALPGALLDALITLAEGWAAVGATNRPDRLVLLTALPPDWVIATLQALRPAPGRPWPTVTVLPSRALPATLRAAVLGQPLPWWDPQGQGGGEGLPSLSREEAHCLRDRLQHRGAQVPGVMQLRLYRQVLRKLGISTDKQLAQWCAGRCRSPTSPRQLLGGRVCPVDEVS